MYRRVKRDRAWWCSATTLLLRKRKDVKRNERFDCPSYVLRLYALAPLRASRVTCAARFERAGLVLREGSGDTRVGGIQLDRPWAHGERLPHTRRYRSPFPKGGGADPDPHPRPLRFHGSQCPACSNHRWPVSHSGYNPQIHMPSAYEPTSVLASAVYLVEIEFQWHFRM